MSDVNLEEYFKGEPANRQCPTCSHISATDEEFMDHLWTHKENESGEHIAPDDKRCKCPHPNCQNTTFAVDASVVIHFKSHTGEKAHVCPHLVNWDPLERSLCGHSTSHESYLTAHRVLEHGYNERLRMAREPWIKKANVVLSAAPLYFAEDNAETGSGGENSNSNVQRSRPQLYNPFADGRLGTIPVADSQSSNPETSVPNPQPRDLDFQSHIPNIQPQILNLQPQVPNLQPQAPNPNVDTNVPPSYVPPALGGFATLTGVQQYNPYAHFIGTPVPGTGYESYIPPLHDRDPATTPTNINDQPQAASGARMYLRQIEVTTITSIPGQFGQDTQIERRIYY